MNKRKIIRVVASIAAVSCFLAGLISVLGFLIKHTPDDSLSDSSKVSKKTEEYLKPIRVKNITENDNEINKDAFYSSVYEQIKDFHTKCRFSGAKDEEKAKAINVELMRMCFEHPELYWLGDSTFFLYDNGKLETEFSQISGLDYDNLEELDKAFQEKVNDIIAKADDSWDTYEKALYIHDYLLDNTEYGLGDKFDGQSVPVESTAYGCLIKGKATCLGYSKAFKLLADKLGIESGVVYGTSENVPYSWNYVKVDNEYYWLDATWDDLASKTEKIYYYFLTDDDHIMKKRTLDDINRFIPECSSLEQYYYKKNNMLFENYSFDVIDVYMTDHADQGMATIVFASEEEYKKCIEDLITNNNISFLSVLGNDPKNRIKFMMYDELQRVDLILLNND